jgi:ABC-type glycerol-3-phosphate transport system substrate-binding protein
MKKKIMLAVSLLLVAALLLSACAISAGGTGTASTTATASGTVSATASGTTSAGANQSSGTGKQKLVIWTNLTADAQKKVLTKQFNEIAAKMGVDVEMDTVAFGDMYKKLATAKGSGDVPDIMQTTEGGVSYLYGQKLLAPMNDVIGNIGEKDFMSSALKLLTVDGTTWGVPDWIMNTSVWYRKDLFQKNGLSVPKTWDEFATDAKKLTADTNGDGKTDIYGFAVPMDSVQVAAQTYYAFLYAQGLYTYDPNTGEYIFGKNKTQETQVLQYIMDLYKTASSPSSTTWTWNDYRNGLVQGNVAMTLDMGAVVGLAQTNNPDMVKNLGCFNLPGMNGATQATFGGTYDFVATNQGGDAKVALAKQFIQNLYTPELTAERALSRPMFAFPSLSTAFDIYKKDASVQPFQDEMNTIYNSLQNGKWYRYGMEAGLNQLDAQIEATTFFGEAMQGVALGQQTCAQAVDYIDQKLQEQIATIKK